MRSLLEVVDLGDDGDGESAVACSETAAVRMSVAATCDGRVDSMTRHLIANAHVGHAV